MPKNIPLPSRRSPRELTPVPLPWSTNINTKLSKTAKPLTKKVARLVPAKSSLSPNAKKSGKLNTKEKRGRNQSSEGQAVESDLNNLSSYSAAMTSNSVILSQSPTIVKPRLQILNNGSVYLRQQHQTTISPNSIPLISPPIKTVALPKKHLFHQRNSDPVEAGSESSSPPPILDRPIARSPIVLRKPILSMNPPVLETAVVLSAKSLPDSVEDQTPEGNMFANVVTFSPPISKSNSQSSISSSKLEPVLQRLQRQVDLTTRGKPPNICVQSIIVDLVSRVESLKSAPLLTSFEKIGICENHRLIIPQTEGRKNYPPVKYVILKEDALTTLKTFSLPVMPILTRSPAPPTNLATENASIKTPTLLQESLPSLVINTGDITTSEPRILSAVTAHREFSRSPPLVPRLTLSIKQSFSSFDKEAFVTPSVDEKHLKNKYSPITPILSSPEKNKIKPKMSPISPQLPKINGTSQSSTAHTPSAANFLQPTPSSAPLPLSQLRPTILPTLMISSVTGNNKPQMSTPHHFRHSTPSTGRTILLSSTPSITPSTSVPLSNAISKHRSNNQSIVSPIPLYQPLPNSPEFYNQQYSHKPSMGNPIYPPRMNSAPGSGGFHATNYSAIKRGHSFTGKRLEMGDYDHAYHFEDRPQDQQNHICQLTSHFKSQLLRNHNFSQKSDDNFNIYSTTIITQQAKHWLGRLTKHHCTRPYPPITSRRIGRSTIHIFPPEQCLSSASQPILPVQVFVCHHLPRHSKRFNLNCSLCNDWESLVNPINTSAIPPRSASVSSSSTIPMTGNSTSSPPPELLASPNKSFIKRRHTSSDVSSLEAGALKRRRKNTNGGNTKSDAILVDL